MTQTNEMIHFNDLINEWHELMCIEEDPTSLEDYGISVINEERVLKLTANYIGKLKGIQDEAESQASSFSARVARLIGEDQYAPSSIIEACDRFLTSVGTVFRGVIPKTIPRPERRNSRTFVIDWSSGQGTWTELGFSFSLEESLLFCAESLAGADSTLASGMAKQLAADLKEGAVSLPRLTQVARGDDSITYYWESAVVSVEPLSSTETNQHGIEPATKAVSPVLSHFEDLIQGSRIAIERKLASLDESIDPLARAAAVMQRIEIEDDGTSQRVEEFAQKLVVYAGGDRQTVIRAMSDCAYWDTVEAVVYQDKEKLKKRLSVMKSCNALCDLELAF